MMCAWTHWKEIALALFGVVLVSVELGREVEHQVYPFVYSCGTHLSRQLGALLCTTRNHSMSSLTEVLRQLRKTLIRRLLNTPRAYDRNTEPAHGYPLVTSEAQAHYY